MKNIFVSIPVIVIPLLFTMLCAGDTARRYAIVEPRAGLVLRSGPSAVSEKITVLPVNSKVVVLNSGKEESIGGRKGRWTEIKFHNMSGWVFGGFLIPFENVKQAWVKSTQGLSLKNNPSFASSEIAIIPYGEKVEIANHRVVPIDKNNDFSFGYVALRWQSMQAYGMDSDLSYVPIPDYGIKYNIKDQAAYERNLDDYFNGLLQVVGDKKDLVIKNIGDPLKITTKSIPNYHEEGKNNIIDTLSYKGLSISVMKVPSGNELFMEMRISSSETARGAVFLGGPIRAVFTKFGIPSHDTGDTFEYGVGDSDYCGVVFKTKNKVVTEITLYCNPD